MLLYTSTHPSVHQINTSIHQYINQNNNKAIHQSTLQPIHQYINQNNNKSIHQSTHQPIHQHINQYINPYG